MAASGSKQTIGNVTAGGNVAITQSQHTHHHNPPPIQSQEISLLSAHATSGGHATVNTTIHMGAGAHLSIDPNHQLGISMGNGVINRSPQVSQTILPLQLVSPFRLKEAYAAIAATAITTPFAIDIINLILDYWYPSLTQALREHYLNAPSIETPMLKLSQPITDINLSITEERVDKFKKDRKDETKQTASGLSDDKSFSKDQQYFEEMYNISVTESIKPSELFTRKSSDKKDPSKILIIGRPGIGKTTMSHYFAHQWASGKLWQEFDYVFWLKLRNLTRYNNKEDTLESIIQQECLSEAAQKSIKSEAVQEMLQASHSKTLFVLDGYDEVAHFTNDQNQQQPIVGKLLKSLLAFPYLILTSRPYHTQNLKQFDRALENMGFTDNNIKQYVVHYYATLRTSQPDESPALFNFLSTNPSVWGSAHVPLNLALICDVWLSAKKNNETLSKEMTITSLYQLILRHLLRHRLKEKKQMIVSGQEEAWLYQQCDGELACLEQLAIRGLTSGDINISSNLQQSVVGNIKREYRCDEKALAQESLFDKTLAFGLLNVATVTRDDKRDNIEKEHYFIHLTFQEYFAARFLVSSLEGNNPFCSREEAMHFIRTEKYTSRYQVMLGFVAGLLSNSISNSQIGLNCFWNTVLSHPLDLSMTRHWSLVIRCLEEAVCDSRILQCSQLLNEIRLGFGESHKLFLPLLRHRPQVLKQSQVLDDLVRKNRKDNLLADIYHKEPMLKRHAIRALDSLEQGTDSVIRDLITVLQEDKDRETRDLIVEVLSRLGKGKEAVIQPLIDVLSEDEAWQVRKKAASTLGYLGERTSKVITGLSNALQNDNENGVKYQAAIALSRLDQSTEQVINVLLDMLHKNQGQSINQTLSCLGHTTDQIIKVLFTTLQNNDMDSDNRFDALNQISRLGQLAEPFIQILIGVLHKDEDEDIKRLSALILSEQMNCTDIIADALINILIEDKKSDVKQYAVQALGLLRQEKKKIIPKLLVALRDENQHVIDETVIALAKLGQESFDIQPLITMLNSKKDVFRRCDVVRILGRLEKPNRHAMQPLLHILRDSKEDFKLRSYAAEALGRYGQVAREVIPTLITMLRAEHEYIRGNAATALGDIGQESDDVIKSLLIVIREDNDWNVKNYAAEALSQLIRLPRVLKDINENDIDQLTFHMNFSTPILFSWKATIDTYFLSKEKIAWARFIALRAVKEKTGVCVTSEGIIIQSDTKYEFFWPSLEQRVNLAKVIIEAFGDTIEIPRQIAKSYLTSVPSNSFVANLTKVKSNHNNAASVSNSVFFYKNNPHRLFSIAHTIADEAKFYEELRQSEDKEEIFDIKENVNKSCKSCLSFWHNNHEILIPVAVSVVVAAGLFFKS